MVERARARRSRSRKFFFWILTLKIISLTLSFTGVSSLPGCLSLSAQPTSMMRPGCCSAQQASRQQLTAAGAASSSSFSPRSPSANRQTSVVACAMKKVKFAKYQGLGNDFILIDNRHEDLPIITPEQAAKICDRNFGIGGDGVIFALPPLAPQASTSATEAAKAASASLDYAMRIYNSDGSEPEMCGNGIRCLARFVADVDEKKNGKSGASASSPASTSTAAVATGAGIIRPEVLTDGLIRVDMGPPTLSPGLVPTTLASTGKAARVFGAEIDAVVAGEVASGGDTWLVTCVSMGNPHAVTFGKSDGSAIEDVDAVDLAGPGAEMEKSPVFPAKANVEFVQILSPSHCKMRVWERGAGPTLACGTGACATVVAGVLEGRLDRRCRVDLPGGPLLIEWAAEEGEEGGGIGGTVYMTGPAELVFEGEVKVG